MLFGHQNLSGIVALLHGRDRSGVDDVVDAALFDIGTAVLDYFLQGCWERGTEPERPGSGHESPRSGRPG